MARVPHHRGISEPVGSAFGKNVTTYYADLSRSDPKYDLRAHLVMSFVWPRAVGAQERHRDYFKPKENE
jgi:hypothetical protein